MTVIAGRLDHIAIAAENTEAMAKWYEKHLGLVAHVVVGPIAPQTQKVFLVGPPAPAGTNPVSQGMMIEIMPRNATPRHDRNSHEPGFSHAAWLVTDFDKTIADLKAGGVKFLSDTMPAIGGGRIVSFADCEGNMIQIVERK